MKLETEKKHEKYYVPAQSPWPIIGAVALFFVAVGAGLTVMQMGKPDSSGFYVLLAGVMLLILMLFGWFKNVIDESMSGRYSQQMNISFKQAMLWFIFSEVMFFMVFFGALFYARIFAVPWLGGAGNNAMTNELLWPAFEAVWPLVITPSGDTTQVMDWTGLPLINTVILLTSSVSLHIAHQALTAGRRVVLKGFMAVTVLLGLIFLILQMNEYIHAYHELGLTLQSGVYGNTFYLLTGFHGLHVTLGVILLSIILLRITKGHFDKNRHFAFQAAAWYWHFVDVVWLCLYLFVYVV
ncbi:cytochrome c oxidase subunit 3 [Psychromonas ossibalaenae]|uniref:cytochrome c oxidase subunit 3 n=1 Tax=Psychromonas ossibalaenae TaxID=444922 RepID=UPI00036E9F17|nr:cytochrome c oxidase subunit 3 [Psychromonas ossibalaenae]